MNVSQPVPISFEVFPPKTAEGLHRLGQICQQLHDLNPHFISVTFGAGGGAQANTQAVVHCLVAQRIPSTPHISCVNMTRERISPLLAEYRQLGIKRLVVVQGDCTVESASHVRDFHYAAELVAYIRHITGDYFHISVAAYPEFHPRAMSPAADLDNLKRKVDAGANSAITQFFYNGDAYSRFLEYCDKLAIYVPIIPGIMPIDHYPRLLRFADACGAEIPLWLRKRLAIYIDDPAGLKAIGIEIVTKLCERLLAEHVAGLHFYTLNQLEPTATILNYLQQPLVQLAYS